MKNVLFYVLSVFLLANCAAKPYKIDTGLTAYVQRFEKQFKVEVKYDVVFSDTLDERYAGMCTSWSDGGRLVEIDRAYWNILTDGQMEQLMFHELGHCSLGRDHNDAVIAGGYPASIMRSSAFNDYEDLYYIGHKPYYYTELNTKGSDKAADVASIRDDEDSDFKQVDKE